MFQFSGWAVFLKDNWDTATFLTNYIPLILFPILYMGSKWWKRSTIVLASEMDFQSGLAEIEAETYDEPPPRNKWEAFWQWLVCVSGFTFWAGSTERAVLDVM
jgi:amino acid transporter